MYLKVRNFLLLWIILLTAACSSRQDLAINKDNVREVLVRFGQENPENRLIIHTDLGDMAITLHEDTPLHRANFIRLIKEGYFEKADFYRVVKGFAIQGGDQGGRKESFLIPAEFRPDHFHKKGALAMARFDEGNPDKASSPTEFYLVEGEKYNEQDLQDDEATFGIKATSAQKQAYTTLGGLMELDGKYTVFGEVTQGLEVIDKIAGVKVNGEKPTQKIPLTIELLPAH